MSNTSMQSLFAAARDDAPDDATHDAMWSNVASATGIAAGATVAAAATSAASTAAKPAVATAAVASLGTKLVIFGLLIGAVSATLGGAVALGWMESQTGVGPESPATAPLARAAHVPSRGAQLGDPTPRGRDPLSIDRHEAPSAIGNVAPTTMAPASSSVATSDLAEEARLVTEARTAIVGGDPVRALALLRKTHRFANRALEPEELSLEARALRALGRADEAAATDMRLKARFPDHALAR